MASKQDYYATLGVGREAKEDEIRKSYRRLVRKYHPDVNPGDKAAEERFKKIQEAYDVLSDAKKREVYDQYGFYSDHIPSGGPSGEANTPPGGGFNFNGFDFRDFAGGAGAGAGAGAGEGAGFGGFRDIFSHLFTNRGGAGGGTRAPERGTDLEYGLNIGFWDSIRGTQVRLNVQRLVECSECRGTGSSAGGETICPDCDGTGKVNQMAGAMKFSLTCPRCEGKGRMRNRCPKCFGEGRVSATEVVEVRIPAGANTGSRLRVAGKGNAGRQGGPAGDLYINVRVDEHPLFHRNGHDVEVRIPVSVMEAALGAKIEVPTIDGKAQLKIPQGTQSGQRLRMREKGILDSRKNVRGDQIVEIVIQAPKAQDERTREILRELGRLHPEDPRQELWSKV